MNPLNILYYLLAIFAIGVIVAIHEGGHFLIARANGIGVMEFSIGMGPRLFTTIHKGTRYSIKAIPFGGSCIMRGDDADMMDPEVMEQHPDDSDIFYNKPVWSRISTVLAGPIFNLILGFLLAIIVLGIAGVDLPVVADVIEGYPAEEAGIQAGDVLVKLDNKRITIYREASLYFQMNDAQPIQVTYRRDGELHTTTLTPKWDEEAQTYYYGFITYQERTKFGPLKTIYYSANEVKYCVVSTIDSIKMMFTGKVGLNNLSGPVGVTRVVGEVTQEASQDGPLYVFLNLLNVMIVISVCLGVMNLLPLPALDGGRLIFLLFEAITGKAVPRDKENIVHMVGIILLLILSVFVFFNDIRKWVLGISAIIAIVR